MRLILPLSLALVVAACSPPAPEPADAPAPAADTPRARAKFQLEGRLNGPVTLESLRQGTEDGKPVLCGEAVSGGRRTAFALRNGFLVLPEDASPEQFAALQAACTAPAP